MRVIGTYSLLRMSRMKKEDGGAVGVELLDEEFSL